MELRYYQTSVGERPLVDWLEGLMDWGPGYRVYFARIGQMIILLLCGGDKRTQQRDIDHAKGYFKDYKARSAQAKPAGRR
jgi:putative addiction module killer protein